MSSATAYGCPAQPRQHQLCRCPSRPLSGGIAMMGAEASRVREPRRCRNPAPGQPRLASSRSWLDGRRGQGRSVHAGSHFDETFKLNTVAGKSFLFCRGFGGLADVDGAVEQAASGQQPRSTAQYGRRVSGLAQTILEGPSPSWTPGPVGDSRSHLVDEHAKAIVWSVACSPVR